VTVTVIIPTWNRAPLLAETLASVQAQTHADFACLVADDGSSDGTHALVEGLADPRFRLLRLARCAMHGKVRNSALPEVRTPLVAFLDDDDRWVPDTLETQLNALGDAGMVFGQMRRFGARTGVWPGRVPPLVDLARLLRGNVIPLSTVLARVDALRAAGGFPEEVEATPDYELWLRVARRFKIVGVERVLCEYRVHEGNMSRRKALELDELDAFYRRLQQEWDLPDALLAPARRGIARGRARLSGRLLDRVRAMMPKR